MVTTANKTVIRHDSVLWRRWLGVWSVKNPAPENISEVYLLRHGPTRGDHGKQGGLSGK